MKPYHLITFAILLLSTFNLKAQSKTNSQFKKLTLATYKVTGSGKDQKVIIIDYIEINNGMVRHVTTFYKGVSDTTYALADSTLEKLNMVFNGTKALKSYMKYTHMPAGHHFGGDPALISYAANNGTTDNLVLISPLMDNVFNKAYNVLTRLPVSYTHVKYKGDAIKNTMMEGTILKYHNACTYLSNIQAPPPMM